MLVLHVGRVHIELLIQLHLHVIATLDTWIKVLHPVLNVIQVA